MATFQVQLNGSNYVSEARHQKFQDALQDNPRISGQERVSIPKQHQGSGAHDPTPEDSSFETESSFLESREKPGSSGKPDIRQALDHSVALQSRMMDIHHQYLSQQAEYIQLITSVLNQQGRVLDTGHDTIHAHLIETFQRTLDHFHTIREGDLKVHEEFLTRQAEFSDRFLMAIESGHLPQSRTTIAPPPARASSMAAQVVQTSRVLRSELDDYSPGQTIADMESAIPEERAAEPVTKPLKGVPGAALSQSLLEIVGEKTGYPPEMLELEMDLEADLGIDSIKRVEILGSLEERYPELPAADTEMLAQTRTLQEIVDYMCRETAVLSNADVAVSPEPAPLEEGSSLNEESPVSDASQHRSAAAASSTNLETLLLEIVAEKTGYPPEVLEPGMDLEADLGIDSIKRVEILGTMEERFPGLPAIETEALSELRTLGQIVAMLRAEPSAVNLPAPSEAQEKKKADQAETLIIQPARLAQLPIPDRLELRIPSNRPLIVSHDGTRATSEIVAALQADNWNVIIWNYPDTLVMVPETGIPGGTAMVRQSEPGKDAIIAALETIHRDHGVPLGFIHLHPPPDPQAIFSAREDELIKQVFLLAGCLKSDLEQPAQEMRNLFMVVTPTGGTLGLLGQQTFQEGSGLSGLVKSLHWEWPGVFCRLLDVDQEMDPERMGRLVIAEIHDPDQGLVEVGFDGNSRFTIMQQEGTAV